MTSPRSPKQPDSGSPPKSSVRQARYLERLKGSDGRRIVVDLDANLSGLMDELLRSGFAPTQVAVVRKAMVDAHARLQNDKDAERQSSCDSEKR